MVLCSGLHVEHSVMIIVKSREEWFTLTSSWMWCSIVIMLGKTFSYFLITYKAAFKLGENMALHFKKIYEVCIILEHNFMMDSFNIWNNKMPALQKCKIRLLKILNVELLFYQDTKNWYYKGKERLCIHRAKEIQASASRRTHTHANTGTKT